MKTFFLKDSINYKGPSISALVLGNFDGVHLGHKELFKKADLINSEFNQQKEASSWAVMTFEPHPKEFFNLKNFKRIYSPSDTLVSLEKSGAGLCLVHKFNESLSDKSPIEFLNEVVLKVKPKVIVVGEDFRFGKDRVGSITDIAKWCDGLSISLQILKLKRHNLEQKISSTLIRTLLSDGDVSTVNSYLCSPFFISGSAIREKGLATELGFPTINVLINEGSNLRYGVYCSRIFINDTSYDAVTNFGKRPSIKESLKRVSLETHILNFPESLVGKEIFKVRVEFLKFLRPESKFTSLEALKNQIQKDLNHAYKYFMNI